MVECPFGMLKINWQEMLVKFDMYVTTVLDIFMYYNIVHNLQVNRDDTNLEELV